MFAHAFKVSLAAALAAFTFSATPTSSYAASAAPLGFQLFCLQQPAQCRGGGKSQVALTNEVLDSIRRVNSQINHSIRPRNDPGPDVWTLGATAGRYGRVQAGHSFRPSCKSCPLLVRRSRLVP